MSFGYGTPSVTLRRRGLLVAMGIFAMAASASDQSQIDPRVVTLHSFLRKLDCPVAGLSEDFIRVADKNKLDWRLLPSIAVVESGGGKAAKNNNIFGWKSGSEGFPTVRSGIELVGYKLGHSQIYRQFDSLGKLRIYNSHKDYADTVMGLMHRISPGVSLN